MSLCHICNNIYLLYKTHLITICRDDNEHIEGCSLPEGVICDTFIHFPVSILEAVKIYTLTDPGIEVESNVVIFMLACLKINCKPVKTNKKDSKLTVK